MAKDDWRRMVGTYHGQTEQALQFIKDVKAHISTYDAMLETDKRFQDPVDTVKELQDIRDRAKELGMMLFRADRQTISYITQGAVLTSWRGVPFYVPDAQMEQLDPDDVESLTRKLLGTAKAINRVLTDIEGDEDTNRRGFHKHTPRHTFVRAICDSYQERFAEIPDKDNKNFCRILEAILAEKGIPRSKLPRTIEDSIPPQHH